MNQATTTLTRADHHRAAVQFNTVYPTPCPTVPSFNIVTASDKRYSLGVRNALMLTFNILCLAFRSFLDKMSSLPASRF